MVEFAPFETELEPPPILLQKPVRIKRTCTECNMVVLAFIAGVFLMAIFDALK